VNTVPTVDPNDAQVYADMFDKDVLNNVFGFQSGLIINIIPGQLYFYGFYSSDVKFKSGKIIAIPAK
jgi:hypothetical protein